VVRQRELGGLCCRDDGGGVRGRGRPFVDGGDCARQNRWVDIPDGAIVLAPPDDAGDLDGSGPQAVRCEVDARAVDGVELGEATPVSEKRWPGAVVDDGADSGPDRRQAMADISCELVVFLHGNLHRSPRAERGPNKDHWPRHPVGVEDVFESVVGPRSERGAVCSRGPSRR
jgi:hypothetical protein